MPSYTKKDDRPDFFRMVGAAAGAGCEQGAAQAWCCARLHAAVPAQLLSRILTSLPPPLRPHPMHPQPHPHTHVQFNARSETVAEKTSFSRLVSSRRCLVLADGFYEWAKVGILGV